MVRWLKQRQLHGGQKESSFKRSLATIDVKVPLLSAYRMQVKRRKLTDAKLRRLNRFHKRNTENIWDWEPIPCVVLDEGRRGVLTNRWDQRWQEQNATNPPRPEPEGIKEVKE